MSIRFDHSKCFDYLYLNTANFQQMHNVHNKMIVADSKIKPLYEKVINLINDSIFDSWN